MVAGLLCIGLILIATSLKNTQQAFAQQLQTDLLGADGFLAWIFAIMAIGAIGYIPGLRTTSRWLLALVGVVVILRNGGLWAQAQASLIQASTQGPQTSLPTPPVVQSSSSSSGSSSSSSGGDSTVSTLETVGEIAAIALL